MLQTKTNTFLSFIILLTLALTAALVFAKSPDAAVIQRKMQEARQLMEHNKHQEAYKKLANILASAPNDYDANLLMAHACEKTNQVDKAIAYLERSRAIKSDAVEPCVALVNMMAQHKGLIVAEAFIEESDMNKACLRASLEALVKKCHEKKYYPPLGEAVDKLIEIDPDNTAYREMRMEALALLGKPDEAHNQMVMLVRQTLKSDMTAAQKTKRIKELQEKMQAIRETSNQKNKKLPPPAFRPLKTAQNKPRRRPRRQRPADNIRQGEVENALSDKQKQQMQSLESTARKALLEGRIELSLSYNLRAAILRGNAYTLTQSTKILLGQKRFYAAEKYVEVILNHYPEEPQLPGLIKRLYDQQAQVGHYHNSAFESKQWHFYRKAAEAFLRIAESDAPLEQRLMAHVDSLRYEYRPQPFNRRTAAEAKARLMEIANTEGASEGVKNEVQKSIQRINQEWIEPLNRDEKRENETLPEERPQ